MLRQAFRESVLVLVAASVLGFSYTALSDKGYFQHKKPSGKLRQLAALAPAMVSLEEAKALHESGAVFLDARHQFEFKQGHIRGALSIPLADFDKKKGELAKISREKTFVTYCDGVDCNSSIALAAKLHEEGYTNVKIFFSGWQDWTANKLPIDASP
ncbi:MAG: rhodanese-like domain-containing protein [Ignavibacteriales bacterium]|nr:rhodanese-like domain-containing protein [Ignavibacteriales bacterium]